MRSVAVTVFAVFASMAISYSVRWAVGSPFTAINFAMSVIIPALVAFPLSYFTFRQSQALADAYAELNFRAVHDGLTKLLNREGFMARVSAIEASGANCALLMIDADHFKQINDGHGHAEGDRALVLIADALRGSCRPHDVVDRIGGEEFAAVLPGLADEDEAYAIAERMRRGVENIQWLTIAGRKTRLTVSIGGALLTAGATSEDVLREADRSLYSAKARGRNRVSFDANALPGDRADSAAAASIAS
jgi:diguanylate cyclase (GGDEF)-like protein